MGIAISIFVFAIGAVLTFALERQVDGINLDAVGVILMVVGIVGAVASMLFWSSFGPFGTRRRGTVVTERDVV